MTPIWLSRLRNVFGIENTYPGDETMHLSGCGRYFSQRSSAPKSLLEPAYVGISRHAATESIEERQRRGTRRRAGSERARLRPGEGHVMLVGHGYRGRQRQVDEVPHGGGVGAPRQEE